MRIDQYIIISPKSRYKYSAKLIKSLKSTIPSNAIAIKLNINIPDAIFQKPQLQATINIKEEDISKPVINAEVLDNIKESLRQNLGVDMNIQIIENKDSIKHQ